MTHTPGPWKLVGPRHEQESRCGHKDCKEHPPQMVGYYVYAGDLWIGDAHGEHLDVPAGQCHANARLIAAAPDLLAALEGLLAITNSLAPEAQAARIAVAKTRAEPVWP